jgi:transcriptional regulator with XRE-family HTH domain
MINLALAETIKELRAKAGITQEELADRASVHRTYVSQLERGLKSPTLEVLFRLAHALEADPDHMVAMVMAARKRRPRG